MPPDESMYPPEWLRIAGKDLERVSRSLRDGDPELTGFCLQQAVEKYLKAFLLSRGWKLQRTHNLEVLLDAATASAPDLEDFRAVCQVITLYYMAERYPSSLRAGLTQEEIRRSLNTVQGLIDRVRELVP
jgi:HEPN domain-containing protein